MNNRENTLRAARFERPDTIPMGFHINPACWDFYPPAALQALMADHPFLFPDFDANSPPTPSLDPNQHAAAPYTDDWACVWETSQTGITGAVTGHPLAEWADFASFTAPDPAHSDGLGPLDWAQVRRDFQQRRQTGQLTQANLQHGHTFLRLQDLRGYVNLMFDMADQNPQLINLLHMVEDFNRALVRRYIDLGVEWLGYPDDLGMQHGPMIAPPHFRQYIKPSYQRLIQPARDAGCVIHMHSDGDIRALAEDLLDCSIDVLNIQDQVNGLDWIAANLAGRVCLEIDIDRQAVTRFGTPDQIDAHIHKTTALLGNKQGGLMMIYGLYPGVPLANARAIMDAMTKYAPLV